MLWQYACTSYYYIYKTPIATDVNIKEKTVKLDKAELVPTVSSEIWIEETIEYRWGEAAESLAPTAETESAPEPELEPVIEVDYNWPTSKKNSNKKKALNQHQSRSFRGPNSCTLEGLGF